MYECNQIQTEKSIRVAPYVPFLMVIPGYLISNPPLQVCKALSGGKVDAYVSGSFQVKVQVSKKSTTPKH